MLKDEFKFIGKNRMILLSVLVIMLIPFLYSIFFLKSVWDPYGDTKDLPVAVVNQDKAVDYQGKNIAVGDEMVKTLKKDNQLGWRFVSAAQAKKGMKDNKYYTVITIPSNFSANAATVLNAKPKKMNLTYETNDSLNYLSQVISGVGVDKLNSEIRAKVTNVYASALFSQMKLVGKGMTKAADGATQLGDGLVTLDNGLNKYTVGVSQVNNGLQTMKVQVSPLSSGVQQLTTAANQLNTGLGQLNGKVGPLATGVSQLKTGSSQVTAGVQTYTNGTDQLAKGVSVLYSKTGALQTGVSQLADGTTSLATNLTSYTNGVDKVTGGIDDLASQVPALTAGLSKLNSGAATLSEGTSKLGASLKTADTSTAALAASAQKLATGMDASDPYKSAVQALAAKLNELSAGTSQISSSVSSQLVPGAQQVAAGTSQLAGSAGALESGVNTLKTGADQLSANSAAIVAGAKELAAGTATLNGQVPTLISGISQLNAGGQKLTANSGSLNSGAAQVSTGLTTLNGQIPALTSGVGQLASGETQLANGLGQLNAKVPALASGVNQLASGASELNGNSGQLTDGASKLQTGSKTLATQLGSGAKQVNGIKTTSATTDMFAAPTKVTHKNYSYVPNYGHALAPYVLSLALYVGALVFNFAYPIRKVSKADGTATQWFVSKAVLGGVVAVGAAVVEATLMMVGGLTVAHVGQYYLFAILFALASMYLVMFLSMLLDNPGRFIAMVLLMLQLGGSGGTFPMEITNGFYNAIHPFLPMSYSILGFRNALTGGIASGTTTGAVWFLIMVIGVSLLLLWMSMIFLQRRHLMGISQLDNNQELQAVEK